MMRLHLHSTRTFLAGLVVLLAACTSPAERIEDNRALFDSLPIAQQELIKQGRVAIGFGEPGVKLALGDPDRVTERTTEQARETIWRYVEYDDVGGGPLYTGYYHRFYSPYYGPYYGPSFGYPYYLDVPNRVERDAIRVVFRDGRVTAIERELR